MMPSCFSIAFSYVPLVDVIPYYHFFFCFGDRLLLFCLSFAALVYDALVFDLCPFAIFPTKALCVCA